MITKRSTWITAIVVWIWISGFYLEGPGFAWSTTIGVAICLSLYKFLSAQEHQPIVTKLPSKDDEDGEGDIDFTKLEGFVPPNQRRPVPRDNGAPPRSRQMPRE